MSLNETILLIALILIIADIFFFTDILSLISYVLLSYLVAINVELSILYQILAGLVTWFIIVSIHYLVWRKFVQYLVHKHIAPIKYRPGAHALIGASGEVCEVEGKLFVEINGDIWPFKSADEINSGKSVEVIDISDGILIVRNK